MGFSLGKALGGIAGGVLGFATGGPAGAIAGARTGSSLLAGRPRLPTIQGPSILPPVVRQPFEVQGPFGIRIGVGRPRAFGGGSLGPEITQQPVPMQITGDGRVCAIPGQRFNRTTYVVRGGGTSRWSSVPLPTPQVIPRGTVCVSRRSLNPGNGRAATRALVRLAAFDRLASRVDKQLRRIAGTRRGGRGRSKRCSCGSNPCKC